MEKLYLNFYNIAVQVETAEKSVLIPMRKDFSAFVSDEPLEKIKFSLQVFIQSPPNNQIPNMVASMQTLNSICYDNDGVRFCD